jgi:hypothetical protein
LEERGGEPEGKKEDEEDGVNEREYMGGGRREEII